MEENEQKREPPKRVTKIKVKKGVYYFGWEVFQASTKNWDQHTLSCKDQPRPELLERLQTLANHVTEICEFGEWETKKLIISGVSLSYSDEGNCYLVITAQKALEYSKAPLIINTPPRPEMPDSDADSQEFCWSDELCADIDALEQEAWMYINGDRAQMSLDFEGGEKEPPSEIFEEYQRDKEKLLNHQKELLKRHGRLKDKKAGGSAETIDTKDMNIGA